MATMGWARAVKDALPDNAVGDEVAPIFRHVGQQFLEDAAQRLGPGSDLAGHQFGAGRRWPGQLLHHQLAVPRLLRLSRM